MPQDKNMCGKFTLVTDLNKIRKNFDIQDISCEHQPSWNIVPGQLIPAIINDCGITKLVCFRWGLIPSWSKDPAIAAKLINARAETVDKKPSFRDAFRTRRCLIIADGFYEWQRDGKNKMPLYYYLRSGRPFGFAGLYETWLSPDKSPINTCIIITTAANELILPIHDRMPVIVSKDQEKIWLYGKASETADLKTVLKPYPAEEMDSKPGIGPHGED